MFKISYISLSLSPRIISNLAITRDLSKIPSPFLFTLPNIQNILKLFDDRILENREREREIYFSDRGFSFSITNVRCSCVYVCRRRGRAALVCVCVCVYRRARGYARLTGKRLLLSLAWRVHLPRGHLRFLRRVACHLGVAGDKILPLARLTFLRLAGEPVPGGHAPTSPSFL